MKDDVRKKYMCYSPILQQYIRANGIKYLFVFKHNVTRRNCWVYELNDALSKILKEYSNKNINGRDLK